MEIILPTSNSALVREGCVGLDGGVTEVRRAEISWNILDWKHLDGVSDNVLHQFYQFDCCMQKREESHLRCFAVLGDALIGVGSQGQC